MVKLMVISPWSHGHDYLTLDILKLFLIMNLRYPGDDHDYLSQDSPDIDMIF